MADNSVKLVTREAGVPKERDPVTLMAGVVPQVPIVVAGARTTIPDAIEGRAVAGVNSDITSLTALTTLNVAGRAFSRTLGFDRVLQLPDNTNLDTVQQSGPYDVSGAQNAPPGAPQWLYVEVFRHSGYSDGSKFVLQRAYGLTADSAPSVRVQVNGAWQPWRKLWSQVDLDPSIFDRRKDVTYYGADATGGSDATAAFNASLADQGVIVVPPQGTFRIEGRVGTLSGQASPQIVGRYGSKARVVLGPNGGFDLSGRGSRIEGITFVPSGVVTAAIRTGASDNTGSMITRNLFLANLATGAGSYFGCILDAFNFWYSSFIGNTCVNGTFFTDYRGIGLRFKYSTNVNVSGNNFACFSDAYYWDVDTSNGSPRYCEGHMIIGNVLIVNKRNFYFQGGALAQLDANILDLTKADGQVLETLTHETQLTNNWLAAQAGGEASTVVNGCHRFKAIGNAFQGNDGTGTHLKLIGAQKPIILANAFDTRAAAIISSGGSNKVNVSHNDFSDQAIFAVDLTEVVSLRYSDNVANGQQEKLPPGLPTPRPLWSETTVVQSSSTPSATQTFEVPVPSGRFALKPYYQASFGNNVNMPVLISIDFDNSTKDKAVVVIQRTDGGNIPANIGMRLIVSAIGYV